MTADPQAPTGGKLVLTDPLFYTVDDVAALLQVSKRHVWRMHDAGRMPAAVRLGRLVRWPKALIDDWVRDGCPPQPRR
jgi:excisionase family DNA binding protein